MENRCPECGGRGVEILYGMPCSEAFEAADRGELVLGGCCFMPGHSPEWQCVRCGHQFGSIDETYDEEEEKE